jgi:5-methylcytosine-specific restriction endonuclease McrA
MGRGQDETLQIPKRIRAEVDARDDFHCRLCGEVLDCYSRVLHHIIYGGDARGMGGRRQHRTPEIITLGWGCHEVVHRNKRVWQPALLAVVERPGVTAMQVRRWAR